MKTHVKSALKVFMKFGLLVGLCFVGACVSNNSKLGSHFSLLESTKPNVLAKIGDADISEADLMRTDWVNFIGMKHREYDARTEAFRTILIEKLIGAEATTANMDTKAFIKEHIVEGGSKVSQKDFDDFLEQHRIPLGQLNAPNKERIVNYLADQRDREKIDAHLDKLTAKTKVEVYFKRPKTNIEIEVPQSAPSWGNSNAPITIIWCDDLEGPFGAETATSIDKLKIKYPDKVKIIFLHAPLPFHANARQLAEASAYIYEHDKEAFWKFCELSLERARAKREHASEGQNSADLSVEELAKEVGIGVPDLLKCIESGKYAAQIEGDIQIVDRAGIPNSTLIINGDLQSWNKKFEHLVQVIDDELRDLNKAH
jgi:protein-disulfide isomerase